MGGKKKSQKTNGYALYAEKRSRELGISFPEACEKCAGEWEATPKDEKER